MKNILFLFALITIVSCSTEYGYEVDPELQPFFESFELAAEARGITVDLEAEGIAGTIDFIRDNTTVGQCQSSEEGNKRVLVDKAFWSEYDFYGKEFIIYHELGHCFLNREHDNAVLGGNVCESIMQSGISGCTNAYDASTRESYLDELFE